MPTKNGVDFWLEEGNLIRIKHWFREGLTDEEVCEKKLDIGRNTFYKWKRENPALEDAVRAGKMPVNEMVADSLIKRAIGYDVKEWEMDESGKKRVKQRHIPGDPTSLIFFLKNRERQYWRDKWDVEVTGELPVVIKDDIEE